MRLLLRRPRQKKQLRFLVLTFMLFLLMGCAENSTEVAEEKTPTSDLAPSATSTPSASSTPENRATSTPTSAASRTPQKQEVQPSDIAPTGTAPTSATPTIKVSERATPSVVATVSGEAASVSARSATITPQVLHTPKARTEWRAMGGEFFVRFKGGIKIFEYYLTVPENWGGIFEMQQEEEDAILFFYTPEPDLKVEVFRLTALQEDSWQQISAAGDTGNQVFEQRGAVFILKVAEENPFDSEEPEAETFQTMLEDVPVLIEETLEIISRRE